MVLLWLSLLGVVKPQLAPHLLLLWRRGLLLLSAAAGSSCLGEPASMLQLGRGGGTPTALPLLPWLLPAAMHRSSGSDRVWLSVGPSAAAAAPCPVFKSKSWLPRPPMLLPPPWGAGLVLLLLLPELLLKRITRADSPAGADIRRA